MSSLIQPLYTASSAFTITLASLATSSTRTAGAESDVVSNISNKWSDVLVAGKITTGTTPTVSRQIDIWAYAPITDDLSSTVTYPDVLDGSASAETITSENVRNAALVLLETIIIDNTSDRTYYMRPTSLAAAFGGRLPTRFGLFIAHDTAVNLNATGSNHAFYYTPITDQVN